MDYSIVIPAFNEEALLPSTLDAVKTAMAEASGHHGEIIVTDNNSTDQTAALAEAGGAKVVFEPHQQIARARNAGAAASDAKYLVFVDADTQINGPLLRASLTALDRGDCCGGGATIQMPDDLALTGRCALRVWRFLSYTFHWACGAYVFCRRDAFNDVGGFDERYYASEEIHLSNSLKRWAKQHGMSFTILRETINSSMRKFEWYDNLAIGRQLLLLGICPRFMQKRDACRFWYTRPNENVPSTTEER